MGRLSMNSVVDLTAKTGTTGPSCCLQSRDPKVWYTMTVAHIVLMYKDPESLLPTSPVCYKS